VWRGDNGWLNVGLALRCRDVGSQQYNLVKAMNGESKQAHQITHWFRVPDLAQSVGAWLREEKSETVSDIGLTIRNTLYIFGHINRHKVRV